MSTHTQTATPTTQPATSPEMTAIIGQLGQLISVLTTAVDKLDRMVEIVGEQTERLDEAIYNLESERRAVGSALDF